MMLPNGFLSHIICAGWPGEKNGACHGDSGGPLTQFEENPVPHFLLLGKV
jgi:hypothetical protein